jgi:hypothetical protein
MHKLKLRSLVVSGLLVFGGAALWADPAVKTLTTGYYEALVKAIPCDCCKDHLEETIRNTDGIGAAQYNDAEGTVRFTVMKGKTLSLPQLTESLQQAQEQMGMGADYTLSEIKLLKKP